MLLTLTTTHDPATDLGYLLGKNPAKTQSFSLSYGQAHVFFPEATAERCTAALLLDVDPVGLVRGRDDDGGVDAYVNDRPYVASSFFAVAMAQTWRSALVGTSRERPELARTPIPLVARLSALPARGGEIVLRKLFEPLGYAVRVRRAPLDESFPGWGASAYFELELEATTTVHALLTHLYVLVPVLDDDKHYWVGDDEVEKLVARGKDWLATHPERELIAFRYLKHRRSLSRKALERLVPEAAEAIGDETPPTPERERRMRLGDERHERVAATLLGLGARTVLDLGCGEGKLLRRLLRERGFSTIAGCDVSTRALGIAEERLGLEHAGDGRRERVKLFQGSATYRDARFAGYDAIALVEVIEHLEPSRLAALEAVVFGAARARAVVITTPNAEFNVTYENLARGRVRHVDHRFEWDRATFRAWAEGVASRHGYAVTLEGIGDAVEPHGTPTQMAIFVRAEGT